MKLIIFIGSRSNYGRLEHLVKKIILDKDFDISVVLANTALDCEMIPMIKERVILEIDADMYNDTYYNISQTISNISNIMSNFFMNHHFDMALCHGDRFETLGFAIASAMCNVKLIHLEANEHSGNIDDKIRNAIDSLSDLKIDHQTHGNPAMEYAIRYKNSFLDSDLNYNYALINYNPSLNIGKDISELNYAIELMNDVKIYWVNPNTDPGWREISKSLHEISDIIYLKNLDHKNYLRWLANANILVGNCSSGIKEGAAFGIPYVLIGDRQKERHTYGNLIKADSILEYLGKKKRFNLFKKNDINTNATRIIIKAIKNFIKKEL